MMDLWEVSQELSRRMSHIFLQGEDGRRPVLAIRKNIRPIRIFRDHILFTSIFTATTVPGSVQATNGMDRTCGKIVAAERGIKMIELESGYLPRFYRIGFARVA